MASRLGSAHHIREAHMQAKRKKVPVHTGTHTGTRRRDCHEALASARATRTGGNEDRKSFGGLHRHGGRRPLDFRWPIEFSGPVFREPPNRSLKASSTHIRTFTNLGETLSVPKDARRERRFRNACGATIGFYQNEER